MELDGSSPIHHNPTPPFRVFEIRDFFEDGDFGGRIILKWILRECVWNGFLRLKIGIKSGML
jgi:hypothetical protein